MRRRRPASRLAVALGIVAATALPGCGSSDGAATDTAAQRAATPVIAYAKQPSDVGPPRELQRLVNVFAGMQRAFRAGDMRAVCRHVSAGLLAQFPRGGPKRDEPCPAKLARFARGLDRERAPRRLEIAWVRTYGWMGGITGVTDRGTRIRIPFQRENGVWHLQLGIFAEPDLLAGRLDTG